jgi:activating signal cointegrator complex subunit 2
MAKVTAFPPMVPFPEAAWRGHIVPEEWEACLDAWVALAGAHLSLSTPDFIRTSTKDKSLQAFLTSYAEQMALSHDKSLFGSPHKTKQLRKHCFLLSHRLLDADHPPELLLRWEFLADLSKIYGRNHGNKIITLVWKCHLISLEPSLAALKSSLTKKLDAGLKGDLRVPELQLKRLNHLLHASPEVAAFFMAGSDFVDSLISCYKLMNPPLRKAIVSTLYLCLIGLTEGEKPNFSSLVDQLYSLKAAAEAHKVGPTNANDSLVTELVTETPILKQVQQRIEASGSGSSRAKSVLTSLGGFRKVGGSVRPQRLIKRKINKGKAVAVGIDGYSQVHVHRMSLVSQVQDLFPDLGSGFVVKLLDEYQDDVEQVISHLLEGSLPAHLDDADRSEELYVITLQYTI